MRQNSFLLSLSDCFTHRNASHPVDRRATLNASPGAEEFRNKPDEAFELVFGLWTKDTKFLLPVKWIIFLICHLHMIMGRSRCVRTER